jgi:Protein of unknown function (DUF5818)
MRKLGYVGGVLLLAAGLSLAVDKTQTFTGEIGDSMCGLKHTMGDNAKDCTEECVKGGAKYILADVAHGKVYQLSDQDAAKKYPGQKVKVTGTLNGETIEVTSITVAK